MITTDNVIGQKERKLLEDLIVEKEKQILLGSTVQNALYASKARNGNERIWRHLMLVARDKIEQSETREKELLAEIKAAM
jgi:hypothetical protein